jgi:hypothetical protein
MTDSNLLPSSPKSQRVPDHLIYPLDAFAGDFARMYQTGVDAWADADVAIVGLARNCAPWLDANLARLLQLVAECRSWRLHIATNDNTDDTETVLANFCGGYPQASFESQTLNRQQFSAEFAGPRTIALAEYRTACQEWVRQHCADATYVLVIDWDAWGGWSHAGVMHGVGSLATMTDAYGMASVSLLEHPVSVTDSNGPRMSSAFLTYDAWAMRGVGQPTNYWDDYTAGVGGWKHHWIPPVGSPPVVVASAFGGLAIYETQAYLAGTYDGFDCEHVGLHRTISQCTGLNLYLDPAMRMIMSWLERTAD